jgi:hypothetical protein
LTLESKPEGCLDERGRLIQDIKDGIEVEARNAAQHSKQSQGMTDHRQEMHLWMIILG